MVSETSLLSLTWGTSTIFGRLPGNAGNPALGAGAGRAAAELHADRAPLAVAQDRQCDLFAGAVAADLVREIVLPRELLAVHGHDQVAANGDVLLALEGDVLVAGLEVGVLGRAPVHDALHERP